MHTDWSLRGIIALSMLWLAATGLARAALAQEEPRAAGFPRVPVMLAMVDSGLPRPGYRILRRHGGGPDDLIVVGSGVGAGTLTAAIHDLILVRRATGDTGHVERSVRVRGDGRAPAAAPAWVARVLADLRAAQPRTLAALGRVRSLRIWLPAQHRGRMNGSGMPDDSTTRASDGGRTLGAGR